MDANSQHSVLRERIVEHLFVGELLRALWRLGIFDAEVLRSEFDAGGYDLVISRGDVVRHVQLKTMTQGGKRRSFDIGLKLEARPSGCVVCVVLAHDLTLLEYLWFGNAPQKRLPAIEHMKVTRHAKANAKGEKTNRPDHRNVSLSEFEKLAGLEELVKRLLLDDS